MRFQDEQDHFRLAATRVATDAEIVDFSLPTAGKSALAPTLDLPSTSETGVYTRYKIWLARCFQEEIDYRQDFLFIPVFIAVGVALWFSLSRTPSLWLLLVSFVAASGLALAVRYHSLIVSGTVKALALILCGMVLAHWQTERAGTIILDTSVTTTITGTVERREVDARGYWRYAIVLISTSDPVLSRAPEMVSVLSRSRHDAVPVGSAITGRARLSPPSGPALPGLNDFAFGSYFNETGATGFFYGAPRSTSLNQDDDDGRTIMQVADDWLYQLRSGIAERIRNVIGGDAGAFAASIVTDERRAISGETMEALRVSGLAHIVAISGLNMALAAGIFFVGMRMAFSFFPAFSQRWPVKKISAFAALIMTLAYYLISGFAVSAERAWLMMSIMLIAVLVDRPSISLRNVALSAIVIIVLSPHEVMGPSFQMSFSATLALVSGYAFWSRVRSDRDRLIIARPPWWMSAGSKAATIVGGVIVTSLIGGISTAIYSIEHFHRVTSYGLAANLAAMPVMSFIVMPFGLVAMLLMPLGLDAPFLKVMGYGMSMVIDIASEVSSWGGDTTIGRQNEWFLLVSTTGFLILTLLRTRLALLGLPFLIAGLVMLVAEPRRVRPDILIYEDGSLVALLSDEAVATNRQRASGFVYDQWARAVPLPSTQHAPVMLERPKQPEEDEAPPLPAASRLSRMSETERAGIARDMTAAFAIRDKFTCRPSLWCASAARKGTKVAVIMNSAIAGTACDLADIVVTSRSVPFKSCRSGAVLISRDSLRRTGSMELWLDDTGNIQKATAAMWGGSRPWSMHRSYDWRSKDFDETLPAHIEEML